MQRETHQILFLENEQMGYIPGDEAAHRAAAALADRADAPTIAALTDVLTFFERIGGQYFLTALRVREEGKDYETAGLAFNYETRDARVQTPRPPQEAFGIEVSDSQGEPVQMETAQPEPPESDVDAAGFNEPQQSDEAPALVE